MLFALAFPDATLNYRLRSPIVVPLLIVVMAIGLWILAREIYAEKGIRGLWLTSTGLHLGNGLMYQVVDWNDILEVQAAAQPRFATIKIVARPGAVDLVWASRWARKKKTRAWLIEIYTLEFDVDSALLYYLLNFYWKYPELRVELASDAAIDRARRGEVLDDNA